MRRILFIAIVFLIVSGMLPTSSSLVEGEPELDSPSFRVFVNPSVSSHNIGATFNVTIEVEDVPELFAWQFTITWDPGILSWGGIFTNGSFLSTAGTTFFVPDLSRVSEGVVTGMESLMGTAEAIGSGSLAILGLTVIGGGETTIDLNEEQLTHLGPSPIFDLLVYSAEEYVLENGYFSSMHDIAITNVMPSKTVVGQGYSLSINVTVENQGAYTESFNVTVYANASIIGTQNMTTIESENSISIAFSWNTSGFVRSNYIIRAYVDPVPGEIDTADNSYIDGTVVIAIVGDVNADGIVNVIDLATVGRSYGTSKGDYLYEPNADINDDGIVDIADLATCAMNYLKTDS